MGLSQCTYAPSYNQKFGSCCLNRSTQILKWSLHYFRESTDLHWQCYTAITVHSIPQISLKHLSVHHTCQFPSFLPWDQMQGSLCCPNSHRKHAQSTGIETASPKSKANTKTSIFFSFKLYKKQQQKRHLADLLSFNMAYFYSETIIISQQIFVLYLEVLYSKDYWLSLTSNCCAICLPTSYSFSVPKKCLF